VADRTGTLVPRQGAAVPQDAAAAGSRIDPGPSESRRCPDPPGREAAPSSAR